jgi:BlaI family penicillinase repressor
VNISDAEWQVMQIIWKRRAASAAEVVADVCPETGWSHRTVRTLLSRLVEKGALSTIAEGKRYIYRAAVSRSRCIREESRSFLKRVFGGDAAELLVHFARDAGVTPEQIDELKRLLDDKRPDGG